MARIITAATPRIILLFISHSFRLNKPVEFVSLARQSFRPTVRHLSEHAVIPALLTPSFLCATSFPQSLSGQRADLPRIALGNKFKNACPLYLSFNSG
jgi:hypothetical protein